MCYSVVTLYWSQCRVTVDCRQHRAEVWWIYHGRTGDALCGLACLLQQAHTITTKEEEDCLSTTSPPPRNEEGKKENLRRRRGWKGLDVVGPLRVKLRNSPVFSFITSARISSASRTAFYIPPRKGKNSFVHKILQDFPKLIIEIYLRRKLKFSSTWYSGQCP